YETTRFSDPIPLSAFGVPIDTDARLQTVGGRASDTWEFAPFGQALAARLQLDGARDWLHARDRGARDRASGGAAFGPTLRLFGERVLVSGNVRIDGSEGFGTEVLGGGGAAIAPLPWLRLRGQAGRAYRVPTLDELFHPDEGFIVGNPDLAPEDAW